MNSQLHPAFGGGATDSIMTPFGLALLVIAIALVLVLPRKWVIVPLLAFEFLTPIGQQLNIGGLHFFALRILILCGCARFLLPSSSTRSVLAGGFSGIDKVFLVWALCRATAFMLLYHEGGAVAKQLGFLWDYLGGYFLVRCLIRDVDDIRRIAEAFVVIAAIMAACMVYEHYKLTDIFYTLLAPQADMGAQIRLGKIRCRGPFEQEIIASVFGGTLVPFFLWLWTRPKARIAAALGLVSALLIVLTAHSSTGIGAAGFGVGTLCLWPYRKYLRRMQWGFVALIVALALTMKAPIWYLIARVDFIGGSTGWDRAFLIDQCVKHFSSWWLIGTADSATWGVSQNALFLWDLCNQFVAEAVQGGLLTLILFLVLIVRSFRRVGAARTKARNRTHEWLLWTIGCILCAHIGGFFGISYFDQIRNWWFVTLAMIPAATMAVRVSAVKRLKPVSTQDLVSALEVVGSEESNTVGVRSTDSPVVSRPF